MKRTFASRVFAARTFNSRTWQGEAAAFVVGPPYVVAAVAMFVPGLVREAVHVGGAVGGSGFAGGSAQAEVDT